MKRRLFLTTLFKGVAASTIAYSLPIVGETFSKVVYPKIIITSRDMRIPLQLRPGGYFLPAKSELLSYLYAKDDAFFQKLNDGI